MSISMSFKILVTVSDGLTDVVFKKVCTIAIILLINVAIHLVITRVLVVSNFTTPSWRVDLEARSPGVSILFQTYLRHVVLRLTMP